MRLTRTEPPLTDVPTVLADPVPGVHAPAGRTPMGLLRLFLELGKARLSALVVVTCGVGFVVGSGFGIDVPRLLATIAGTALAALSANALNQCWEVARDGRMRRTAHRPLPSRRVSMRVAVAMGVGSGAAGIAVLAVATNLTTTLLGVATILLYVLVYTPLKARTIWNTHVGAVVGAIPPVMGYAAAAGSIGSAAWVLFGVLFLWQVPHFLALAWLYREDYAVGGYRMLPVVDRHGVLTASVALAHAVLLIPLPAVLMELGFGGSFVAVAGAGLGVWLVYSNVRFLTHRSAARAKSLFLVSVAYLPLLMALMVIDRRENPDRIERPAVIHAPQPLP